MIDAELLKGKVHTLGKKAHPAYERIADDMVNESFLYRTCWKSLN